MEFNRYGWYYMDFIVKRETIRGMKTYPIGYSIQILLTAFSLSIVTIQAFAQANQKSVVIGEMVSKPNAVLILNPPNHNQGFLAPQLTTAQRVSMSPSTPAEDGLMVFDITQKAFYFWKNGQWVEGLGNKSLIQNSDIVPGNVGQYLGTTATGVAWTTPPTGSVTNIITGPGLTGGPISTSGTIALVNSGVTAGTYGSATTVSRFSVDNFGRVTSANNVSITGTVPGGAASGDLGATYPSPTVAKLQSNPVKPGALGGGDIGKVLVWDGAQWTPQIVVGVSPVVQSYSIDPSDFINIRRDDKKDKVNMVIFEDNNTFISSVKKDEGTSMIAPLHLPQGATIQQVILYYMDKDPQNIEFDFQRKPFTGSNENIIPSWTSTGNSGVIQTATHTPIAGRNVVDNDVYTYRVVVRLNPNDDANDANDTDHRIYAIRVRYLP